MRYEVNADLYDGPLSLLVELARLNVLDLFLIKLQALTAGYLSAVKQGRAPLNELAEPLPLLGQLIAMKAKLLLPQPLVEEDEELPISLEQLERQLREYEQFKSVAQILSELHTLQHHQFTRGPGHTEESFEASSAERGEGDGLPLPPGTLPFGSTPVGVMSLMSAFAKILEKASASIYEVTVEPWTVEMKVEELTLLMAVKRQVSFGEIFSSEKTKLELVVLFLALLELVRRRVCMAMQEQPFSDILIVRVEAA